ncbi:MAG: phytoene/squalene synthase family protein [Aggregatilineales bacterium]
MALDLEAAYRKTEDIIRQHSKSFHLATRWLPPAERRAVRALYAFCRATDNLVDDPELRDCVTLEDWRALVNSPMDVQREYPVLLAWADTRVRYVVPPIYGDELIDGCEMDLQRSRYQTFNELEHYCYCVASTVGLMAIHILGMSPGVAYKRARPYVIKLGVALQLTNILRDVGEDARRHGRIYLPLEDMARFGVREADIMCGRLTNQMVKLLQFESERTHCLYQEAWPGIALLAPNARFAVAVAADMYWGILDKIRVNGYDVFSQRAFLTKTEKLRRLPGIWLRTRQLALPH